jgi:hypothetical protein
MAKRKQIDDDASRPGWAKPRDEVKDEPRATNFNISRNIGGWKERAAAHSGPAFAPGTGHKSKP